MSFRVVRRPAEPTVSVESARARGLTRASPPSVAARALASVDLVGQVKAITGIR